MGSARVINIIFVLKCFSDNVNLLAFWHCEQHHFKMEDGVVRVFASKTGKHRVLTIWQSDDYFSAIQF